jgi:hypothetical protein
LTLGAAAVACELAIAGHTAGRAGAWSAASAAAGLCVALALALALALRRPGAVPWTVFALGVLYAATLRGALDGWSIAVAVGLLLAAELAYWSIEDDRLLRVERTVTLRRGAGIAGLIAATLAACFLVVAAAGLEVGAGLPLAAAGAVAAVGLLLLVARLARGRRVTSS